MQDKTIMIVEDVAGIREKHQLYLNEKGYHAIRASRVERALAMLHETTLYLILLDIEMPGMDGFTVCQEIRKKITIPIIFLTVRRDTIDKIKCFELGEDDYVTKPFDFEELNARIKANIRRYDVHQNRYSNILKYNGLEIQLHNFKCYLDGQLIML